MGGCFLEGCRWFSAGTELEDETKGERRLEEGDREGHGPKTGRSARQDEEEEDEGEEYYHVEHLLSFYTALCRQLGINLRVS